MQKLFLAALILAAGYFAYGETGTTGFSASPSAGSGGAGFSQFGRAAGTVVGSAVTAVRN